MPSVAKRCSPSVLAIIGPIKGKRIFERVPRGLERNAMLGVVLDGLGVVPLECAVVHKRTA